MAAKMCLGCGHLQVVFDGELGQQAFGCRVQYLQGRVVKFDFSEFRDVGFLVSCALMHVLCVLVHLRSLPFRLKRAYMYMCTGE